MTWIRIKIEKLIVTQNEIAIRTKTFGAIVRHQKNKPYKETISKQDLDTKYVWICIEGSEASILMPEGIELMINAEVSGDGKMGGLIISKRIWHIDQVINENQSSKLLRFRKLKNEAVKAKDYEKAAEYRDEEKKLELKREEKYRKLYYKSIEKST